MDEQILRKHGIGACFTNESDPNGLILATCLCGNFTGPLDTHMEGSDDLIAHIFREVANEVVKSYKPALQALAKS